MRNFPKKFLWAVPGAALTLGGTMYEIFSGLIYTEFFHSVSSISFLAVVIGVLLITISEIGKINNRWLDYLIIFLLGFLPIIPATFAITLAVGAMPFPKMIMF
jgi:hypothetical protein